MKIKSKKIINIIFILGLSKIQCAMKNNLLNSLNTNLIGLKNQSDLIIAKSSQENAKPISAGAKKIKVKTRNWGKKYGSLSQIFGQVSDDRKELKELRDKYILQFKKEQEKGNPDYAQISKNITKDTIKYIQKRISETIKKIGPAPTQFCVFSMGSMAREESAFYTDLEIGVLVKKKDINVEKYFEKFAQVLSDRLFLLGEHPDVGGKGMRIDEADNAPIHRKFFARHSSPEQAKALLTEALFKKAYDQMPYEGSRLYISTPKEFAQHVNKDFTGDELKEIWKKQEKELFDYEIKKAIKDKKNKGKTQDEIVEQVSCLVKTLIKPLSTKEKQLSKSISTLVRNITPIYGNKALFDQYIKLREIYLNGVPKQKNPNYKNRREEIAYLKMKEDILKYIKDPKSAIATGKLGDVIDLKREIYRFPEQIITDLGFWHKLDVQNTIKITQKLAQKGLMNQCLADQLADLMNYCMGLRFKKQAKLKKQGFAIPVTKEAYDEMKQDLEDELEILNNTQEELIKTHSTNEELEENYKKISKLNLNLNDLKNQIPGQEDSILDPKTVETLNTKYLPILKRLHKKASDFIKGNKDAFLTE